MQAKDAKSEELEKHFTRLDKDKTTTLSTGMPISDDDHTLTAGERGPQLLKDHIFHEKMQHFDHERIPERVVHARGTSAHGYFQVYKSQAEITCAKFLQDPSKQTPVFIRFSTVLGSRGAADTARDVRGFSVRFYTEEGNYDLVGNNIPVFFVQDAIKFPDLIHAAKPEPHNERPQAGTAHDNAWDFFSLNTETTHMTLWVLSDRAIPRSFRTMQGFGVNTYIFVNAQGKGHFVKFHWKPMQGLASLVWDEAQKIAGKNTDFHREDLWKAIEMGDYPEWELGVQIVDMHDTKLNIDILDATKFIPEEIVPVVPIGKMVLNRNLTNFFAEAEQVAFCPSNIVPGIDFSEDPLLQGRVFSYKDTQLNRHRSPNFNDIPINRPLGCCAYNNERDGNMQTNVVGGVTNFFPNSRGGNWPRPSPAGFKSYDSPVKGTIIRTRPVSFSDHFSQAQLFYNSMTPIEKQHIIEAARFELGKVESIEIRKRMVANWANVDHTLASLVAKGIGVPAPEKVVDNPGHKSPAVSMEHFPKGGLAGKQVAILVAPGVNGAQVAAVKKQLTHDHVYVDIVGPVLGPVKTHDGSSGVEANKTYVTASPVLYDGIFIPGGQESIDYLLNPPYNQDPLEFVKETYKHAKPIGGLGEASKMLVAAEITAKHVDSDSVHNDVGVVSVGKPSSDLDAFITEYKKALVQGRFWARQSVEVESK